MPVEQTAEGATVPLNVIATMRTLGDGAAGAAAAILCCSFSMHACIAIMTHLTLSRLQHESWYLDRLHCPSILSNSLIETI